MSHVQTLRKNDTEHDSTCHRHLIKEQAGFRSGKSCTSQLINLTQHIEDGYEKGMITGTAFVDLSAAYDTVNHRLLIQKLYNTTLDSQLCSYPEPAVRSKILCRAEQWAKQMENTKERSTTGECSLPHRIQHIYERSANPRWKEEFHIRRRPVRHSPVPYLPRSRTTNWRGTGGTDTLLQKQVCVRILTRRKSRRFICGTGRPKGRNKCCGMEWTWRTLIPQST